MPHPIANTFMEAAELLGHDSNRRGNLLSFSAGQEVVFAGDIHGHRANLAKIISFANLSAHPNRRLVLHEIIHGNIDGSGQDRSFEVLLRAVRLKLSCPGQVFFLMGNHDVAQITGNEITKAGAGACRAFDAGLAALLGPDAPEVRAAVMEMLRSQPLAGRCENGMLLSHSLPAPNRMEVMDWEIFQRPYQPPDFRRGGAVYEWTWGRDHTAEQLVDISVRLEVRQFLLGHQPYEQGVQVQHGRLMILGSEHAQGRIIVFDAGLAIPDEELLQHVRPIVALS